MKQFKYKPAYKTTERAYKELPVKKFFNWKQAFYIFLFIAIIAFLVYKIPRYSEFNLTGTVVCESTEIKLADDIKVLKCFVKEGDTIKKGDTLLLMKTIMSADSSYSSQDIKENAAVSYYLSSINGIVDTINIPLNNVINKNREILIISDFSKVYVETYVNKKIFDNYSKRKIVNIHFPNGFKSYGKFSKDVLKFLNNQSDTDKSKQLVLVRIDAVNDKDLFIWRTNYKNDVEISK